MSEISLIDWMTAIGTIGSAVIALGLGVYGVVVTAKESQISRKQASSQLCADMVTNEEYRIIIARFRAIMNHFRSTSQKLDDVNIETRIGSLCAWDSIRDMHNIYEIMAIGINEGLYLEGYIKKWWRSTLINDWFETKEYIERKRMEFESPNLFSNFELLAVNWSKE
ncbi:MAG: DUF4760 domain-containing protein [Oceanicaulis sp.]